MNYLNLDNDELTRVALDAISHDRHSEALSLLNTLLECDPNHVFGNYLLAAQHAQLGMWDRAEDGFRRTVELAPNFPIARFQYGQILMVKGDAAGAKAVLASLTTLPANDALGGYARGLTAASDERPVDAIRELQAGLGCAQEIPALEQDMKRVLDNLIALRDGQSGSQGAHTIKVPMVNTAPLYLSKYGKSE